MNNRPRDSEKRRDGRRVVPVLLFGVLLALAGCQRRPAVAVYALPDTLLLRSGDLVFRTGVSRESRAVTALDRKSDYTHVGMVVLDGDHWRVLHAVPNERATEQEADSVKLEPLEVFFRSDRAVQGGVYRYPLAPGDTSRLLRRGLALYYDRHPLFDTRFDETDTNAFYCTELVCFLYRQAAGVDLSEGRRHQLPLFPNLIFCSDVFQNSRLEEIWRFER